MKRYAIAGLTAMLLTPALPALAQNAARTAATELAEKAVATIQKVGVEQACKQFADPKAGYIQGDVYVVVQDMQCKMVCHPLLPKMNGKDMTELKDSNGKYFTQEMKKIAQSGKPGWVDYVWPNPTSKALEPKSAFIQRVDEKYMVSVGIYDKK
ncbi:cache domain-containing protein [Duganella sp. BJB1802]|uniref:cache domain-containing protein n=1 Tax=Duganella sp. BJB1802 TaxID=2744575 RepID=UPI0015942DB4|nr:cache domain-containing protein [Duganella sp. BJB1802]NVD71906.1 cache domain-containing protein [Duganella sp. BJB1802]